MCRFPVRQQQPASAVNLAGLIAHTEAQCMPCMSRLTCICLLRQQSVCCTLPTACSLLGRMPPDSRLSKTQNRLDKAAHCHRTSTQGAQATVSGFPRRCMVFTRQQAGSCHWPATTVCSVARVLKGHPVAQQMRIGLAVTYDKECVLLVTGKHLRCNCSYASRSIKLKSEHAAPANRF